MRLHELTKELDADGRRLLQIAKELGLGVRSHSSNLPPGTEGILRAAWNEELEELKAAAGGDDEADEKAADDISISVTVKTAGAEAEAPAEPEEPAAADEPAAEVAEAEEPAAEAAADAPAEEPTEETPAEPVAEEAPAAEPADDQPAEDEAPAEEPVAQAEDEAEAEDQPAADDADEGGGEQQRQVVVTFAGKPAGGDEPEPEADEPAAEGGGAGAQGDGQPADGAAGDGDAVRPAAEKDKEVEQIGRVNVPTRRERKGAKILGKIDLSPKQAEPERRSRNQPAYDPLDPTRAMPDRGRPGTGGYKKDNEPGRPKGRPGKGGGGGGDFVFDPEDSSSLSAIRLGHFGNRRRPPPRRPPVRRGRMGGRKARKNVPKPTHPITVRPPIGVRELSLELGVKAREILMSFPGTFDPRDKNAVLDAEHLLELAVALDREINILDPETAEGRMLEKEAARAESMAAGLGPRAPVVAVMGHVDHGKTTLLDTLRKTRVAAKEAGGITQNTSAYSVETPSGGFVTFLDTPGHKAFTEMRARGAQVTDVAVLVVSADDGVMDQTQEAIDHARAAGVPMVVAINKIDKPGADPMKVRQELASAEVFVEDYGGEVGVVECSALTGQGLDTLLERLALETEILELQGDPGLPARGVVIDSRKDSKLGVVATVVIQEGTLRAKDPILAGTTVGRVRWLLDDRGKRVKEAGPSVPVQVVGFEEPPRAGAPFRAVADLNDARNVAAERKEAETERAEAAVDTVTLENLFDTIEAQKVTEINVLLKADNMGSLDVLRQSVEDVSHPEVRFKVIRAGVGAITEDDVVLASASGAFIIGFGVVADTRARPAIAQSGVEVKYYDVIYEMAEDLEAALEGELGTETHEEVIGHATIRAIFKASKYGNIAGCYVTDGTITKDAHYRLVRDGVVVHTGKLDSLKRFKDDVKEVRENYECGLHLSGYNDIKEEDVLEAFVTHEVKRTLESESGSSAS